MQPPSAFGAESPAQMRTHLLWLTQGEDSHLPSLRLRVLALQDQLSEHYQQKVMPTPTSLAAMWRARGDIQRAEVVILQKALINRPTLWLLRRLAARLVYDFDDAVYVRLLAGGDCRGSKKRMARFQALCRSCDVMHAGNAVLAEAARNAGASQVVEIPTAVADQTNIITAVTHDEPCIGWIGTDVNLPYLEALEPVFVRLADEGLVFSLHVMSGRAPSFRQFSRWYHHPWQAEAEAAFLNNIDIGLMPLADNDHTRGKCAYKALQYMSFGKPVVVSDVGVNAQWTRGAGFAADSTDAFCESLRSLLANPALRATMGEIGRSSVLERFTRTRVAARIHASLQHLLSRPQALHRP